MSLEGTILRRRCSTEQKGFFTVEPSPIPAAARVGKINLLVLMWTKNGTSHIRNNFIFYSRIFFFLSKEIKTKTAEARILMFLKTSTNQTLKGFGNKVEEGVILSLGLR